MKKGFSIIMAFVTVMTMLFSGATFADDTNENTENKTKESNFTNLIVFARFLDEDEFIDNSYNGESVRKITDNTYNSAYFNVSDYYEIASRGSLKINSVYLFNKGGSVQLSHTRGYYAEYSEENPEGYRDNGERAERMYELKTDWSESINRAISAGNVITNYDGTKKYNFSELDKNNDGVIDAITIIYKNTTQSISVGWSSPLWNYKDYADYVKINADGKTITSKNYVQVTNSYNYLYKDNRENVILPMAVATHEMGHILGFKDLYNSSNSSPVYYMSAMAKHMSPVPQFISVKEREAKGWLTSDNVKTIYQNGQYTLKEASTRGDSQIVGYKLNLKGTNKTLYLEYRNFGTGGNKYDCQSKELYKTDGTKLKGLIIGSGLVCYLVDKDTKFPNNMGCVAGKWNYETLGGTYATKSDAPLKLNQSLEITDDMYVEVTNITDNQLTFKIEGDFEEQQTEIKEISDREKYDGRDDGIVTPVKDQGDTNLCWAYSSIAAAESSILKSGIDPTVTKDTLSLNPMAAAYRVFKRESDPLGNTDGDWQSVNYLTQSGDPLKIAKLYSMWWAPVSGNVVTTNPYDNPSYRFENAIYIPENKSNPEEYIRSIKKAIAKYGAVTFQYNNARETLYYNPKNEHSSTISPHACTIIGWDDNIPSDKFVPNGATKNGGWLVKNSYKSLEYFWLSYDNTSSCSYAFSFAPKDKYDFNYYYDGSMDDFPLRKDKSVANVFKAKKSDNLKDEYIKAVNVAIGGENVTAKVEIYKNVDYPYGGQDNVPVSGGYLANTTTAYFENSGYVTIELNQPVKIEKDQWFSAIVSVSNENGDAKIMTSYKNGREMSYINNGSGWTQLKNYVGRIKVYTKLENKVENPTIEVPTTEAPTTTEVTTTSEPTTEAPTTAEVTTTSEPTTEALTTAEVTTTLKPTTEVTTTLEPTTEKQTETTVTVEPTTEILTTENTTSETTVENQTTDETTSEKESTTTFGQVVTKENEPTTNGKTTTRVDGVNKKSLKQTKILKVKKLKNRKVRIAFKKVSKAKIYWIQYSTDRKFKKNVRTKRTGKNTYLLRKLRVRKRYYVRVRAIVGKDKGKWSSVKSFKVSKRFYK